MSFCLRAWFLPTDFRHPAVKQLCAHALGRLCYAQWKSVAKTNLKLGAAHNLVENPTWQRRRAASSTPATLNSCDSPVTILLETVPVSELWQPRMNESVHCNFHCRLVNQVEKAIRRGGRQVLRIYNLRYRKGPAHTNQNILVKQQVKMLI
ncbi:hypothetical protein SUGI_0118910 [Cryptomeria japonica]|nr:hypothetical protein SUGI_0118910 [Cryptomeria japonica]